jgi:hypothetical protein
MTDSPLEQINLLDTDYADILAHSSHPAFEMQLVKSGIDTARARTATNFIVLMRQKPDTPEEWAALTEAWEEACGFEHELEHLQLLVQLLWNNQRNGASDR